MSKGARAMVIAMIYPEPDKGGRGKNSFFGKEFSVKLAQKLRSFLSGMFRMARAVLRELPEVLDE
jgi:hypothetical protein